LVNNIQLIINEDNEFIIDDNENIKPAKDVEQKPTPQKQKSAHQRRSIESRQRRNQKRNNTHRMRRYQQYITRPLYYKFKMPLVKKILKQHHIKCVHVKVVNGLLIIGVNNYQKIFLIVKIINFIDVIIKVIVTTKTTAQIKKSTFFVFSHRCDIFSYCYNFFFSK
jgi:hypothetical protein